MVFKEVWWSIKEGVVVSLKGQCHEIFDNFFLKRFDLVPYEQGKKGFVNYFVFAKIFTVSA